MAADPLCDSFGLPVSTASSACLEAVNAYYEAVLAYKPFPKWSIAEDAVNEDAKCPMARVLAADFACCSGKGARCEELLKGLLAELSSAAGDAEETLWTWRERMYCRAWESWVLKSDPAGCYSILLEVVKKHPQDLFAVKRGHIMGLILGSGARILEIVEEAGAAAGEAAKVKFLHGMWAFGLEQEGRYEDAEAKAQEGLALQADLGADAWLDHGLAHALYFQGSERLEEAIGFLESRKDAWSPSELHPFLYTHNWWHLSLLYCEKRSFPEALSIFDERLWAHEEMLADPQVQLNALGLLWRLETRGQVEVARPRWRKVLDVCRGVTAPSSDEDSAAAPQQHGDLLLDVLITRGFAALASSNAASLDAWLLAIRKHAEKLSGEPAGAGGRADAYGRIAQAIADMYRTDQPEGGVAVRHAAAREELKTLRSLWSSLGGSEEQRGILLEAVEGPVVCGAPETNFDKLFF